VRILLVDDHPLFLDALRNMLESRGLEVVGVAGDGFEALAQARALRPDIVLMDIQMPKLDGLATLRLLKAEMPAVKVLMLTMSADDEDLFEAIKSGASGYLLKTRDSEEFFTLLADAEKGDAVLSRGLASRILSEFRRRDEAPASAVASEPAPSLTERQMTILDHVAHGLAYKEIGPLMGVTERTIKYHMGEIVERLHVRNRAEAIRSARESGLIP
jgi:two-component system NarL family response regulator